MSMISELVEELIDNADLYTKELHDLMYRAAETIVMLSEKAREPKQESQNGYQSFNGTSVYVSRIEDEPQTDCKTCLYIEECDWQNCCYEQKIEPQERNNK